MFLLGSFTGFLWLTIIYFRFNHCMVCFMYICKRSCFLVNGSFAMWDLCRIHDSVSLLSVLDLWYLLSEVSVPAGSAVQRPVREYKNTSTICYDKNY